MIFDASRGSAVWHIYVLRSDLLTALLNDLVSLERKGLPDSVCDAVKGALGILRDAAAQSNNSAKLCQLIQGEVAELHSLYVDWNDGHKGDTAVAANHRRLRVRDLKELRKSVCNIISSNQRRLTSAEDLELALTANGALVSLADEFQQYFPQLKRASVRYRSRIPS